MKHITFTPGAVLLMKNGSRCLMVGDDTGGFPYRLIGLTSMTCCYAASDWNELLKTMSQFGDVVQKVVPRERVHIEIDLAKFGD